MLGEAVTNAVLDDWRTAPVDEKLRMILGFLRKLTLAPEEVRPDDVCPMRKAGLSDEAIRDAIYVATLFNIIDRIADALDFDTVHANFPMQAKMLLKFGYRM